MLIPRPTKLIQRTGRFVFEPGTAIRVTPGAEPAARLLRHYLHPVTGLALPLAMDGTVLFALDERLVGLGTEGYALTVGEQAVVLRARRLAGLRHGVQTIRQLLPDNVLGETPGRMTPAWSVPCLDITDVPRFGWRGAMLDVARHFQPLRFLRRFVDLLALHKLNVLHLHLTDDQGWRMPVSGYPLLTEIGGWRTETMTGPFGSTTFDGTPHGGAYTQTGLRALVAYAAERGVRVLPEIEMPGHARAALAAYPALGNHPDRRLPVWTGWGISEMVFGVQDETLEFCRTVLGEVMDVFPGEHVHIGGDECPATEWAASPTARNRVASERLTGPPALHGWFLRQISAFLLANGRTPVCWEETNIGTRLDPRAVVMPWRDTTHARTAIRRGHQVVPTPWRSTYLDYPQSAHPDERPGQPGGIVTLRDVYQQQLPAGDAVLGSQCQIWTEQVATTEHIEYLAFPRLCALADTLWSDRPDWADFAERLLRHQRRLAALSVTHHSLVTTP